MVATILLAWGFWVLIRTGGFTADGDNDFAWRWTETPEERLLAQEDPVEVPPSPAPAKKSAQPEEPAKVPAEKVETPIGEQTSTAPESKPVGQEPRPVTTAPAQVQ